LSRHRLGRAHVKGTVRPDLLVDLFAIAARDQDRAAATACTLSSMRTFFPTSRPPDSRETFQVSPQSSRSTSVAALKPLRSSAMVMVPDTSGKRPLPLVIMR